MDSDMRNSRSLGKFINIQIQDNKLLHKILLILVMTNSFGYSFYYLTSNGYPLVDFMKSHVGRFDDFYNNLMYPGDFYQTKANFVFFPLATLFYKIFSLNNIHLAAFIFFVLTSAFLFYSLSKIISNNLFLVIIFFSYPYHFTIARGNNEIIIVGLAAVFYYALTKGSSYKLFGSFYGIMLFEPYIFYVLQFLTLSRSVIKKLFYSASFLLIMVLVLYIYIPVFKVYINKLLFDGGTFFTSIGPGSSLHTSGLSGLTQFIYWIIYDDFPYDSSTFKSISILLLIIGVIGLIVFFTYFNKRLDLVTSSLLIVCAGTLLNGSSFDYRLLHFFIPLAFLLNTVDSQYKKLIIYLILLLFAPKPYMLFQSTNNAIGETLGSVMNPIIILGIIIVTIMRYSKEIQKQHV
jgi:hypothetical protein